MTGSKSKEPASASTSPEINECVSHLELRDMMRVMTDAFNNYQTSTTDAFQRIHTSVDGLRTWMDELEARLPQPVPPPITHDADALVHNDTEDEFDDDEVDAQHRRRLLRNRQGMGGNGRHGPHAPEQR